MDESGAHDLDGQSVASSGTRAAHLAGVFPRKMGGGHAHGGDHAPETRLHSPQRSGAQRKGDRARTFHSQWQRTHVGDDRHRPGVSHRAIHQEPEFRPRSRLPNDAVPVLRRRGGGATRGTDSALSAWAESVRQRARGKKPSSARSNARWFRNHVSRVRDQTENAAERQHAAGAGQRFENVGEAEAMRQGCSFFIISALLATSPNGTAQTRSATPPVMPEKAREVADIQILQVRGNLFMLVGPGGSNSLVQVGDEGVLVVDTMTDAAADHLVTAIRTLSDRPILLIVNTHAHLDHVGGNVKVRNAGVYLATGNTRGGSGASILASEATLNRMSADGSPYAAEAWPTDTFFVRQKDLFMNGEGVELLRQPAAHTDGDVMAFFRRSDVLATGDVFTPDRYPVIGEGGTIDGVLAGLNHILDLTIPEFNQEGGTLVVPGHGRLCDEADVGEYRDMVTIVRDRVQDMINHRATLDQVKAAKLTLDYDGLYATPDYNGEMFVEAVYKSLTSAAAKSRKK
ncbi:MAG: hypothetical protein C5B57_00205 [Blastocatellia bacterium]|nr:MAG: hypothetical protein C5B57_00205 [Blastocatellia bacterium]